MLLKILSKNFLAFFTLFLAIVFILSLIFTSETSANTNYIYDEALGGDWQNWSWGSNTDFSHGEGFQSSKSIIQVSWNPWPGLYLHSDKGVDSSVFTTLNFAIKPVTPNSQYKIALFSGENRPFKDFVPVSDFGQLETGKWKNFSIPLSDLNAAGKTVKGLVIHETSGHWTHQMYIDDIHFSSSPIEQVKLPAPDPTPVPTPTFKGYTTSGGKIYKNGSKITLKGVNWFGAETETFVPHGLWARNYKDMISQMKNLGFNAVRIPVCPQTLHATSVNSIDYSKNQELKGRNSLDILHNIVGELNNQQMFILMDHHRPNCKEQSDLWYTNSYSEDSWVNDLKTIADQFKYAEYFIGIDLKNEPYGRATWGTGNSATDWNKAAERAGKAVLNVNPNLLVFVQGVGENPVCSSNVYHFWGQNLEPQKCTPISTSEIPGNKLVLSPHVYGPDVNPQYYFDDPNFPKNMPGIWDIQFGFLAGSYAIVPGEWGGKYGTAGGNFKDRLLQDELVNYYRSRQICSSFYWSWNPNSTDTGGILQDDWWNPWSDKINLVKNMFQNCN